MPRYTQEEIDRVMGALMASAAMRDGEWEPNIRLVARQQGISRTTLMRWWAARDRAQDGPLRAAATRAADDLAEEGAADWLASVYLRCRRAVDVTLDDLEEARETGVDNNGRGWEIGPNVAQRAGATKTIVEIAEVIDAKIAGKGEDVDKVGAALRRLKDTIHRTGLGKQ